MSKKSPHIAERIARHQGASRPAHYLGYFDCFNSGLYYEAHDVLEELWLAQGRQGTNYAFYKGLIQLAGAFVHLQKQRLKPSVALFTLADNNLRMYPNPHEGIDTSEVLALISDWRSEILGSDYTVNPLGNRPAPQLQLPSAP
jgi:predicted metal-dependent hydrolase